MTGTVGSPISHPHLSRRQWLQAGSIGLMGLTQADVQAARDQNRRAPVKSVIYLFLSGGLGQHDSFDMKPDAPDNIRGEFDPVSTRTPGLQICEHLPRLADCSDKWAVVRSLSHSTNGHSLGHHIMLTGRSDTPRGFSGNKPQATDHPSIVSQVGYLLRDRSNPNSIVSCIAVARENARQIRDVITTEMWEQINDLHWSLQDDEDIWREPVQEQLRIIRRGCQLVYGITDTTLSRDLSWLFSQLGRLIERADKTSRILDVKYFLLLPSPEEVGGVLDELQWITLLRTAGAYQMYRQSMQHAISPASVARFLLLDPIFPRSVRYCLQGISDTLQQIQRQPNQDTPDDLDCLRGQLLARWSYVRIDNLIEAGLHEAIDQLQQDLNQLHNLIQTRYFTSAELRSTPTDHACALSSFTA